MTDPARRRRRIEEQWEKWRKQVFTEADKDLLELLRLTFFKGATAVLAAGGPGENSDEQAKQIADEVADELREFFIDQAIDAGEVPIV